MKNHVWRPLLVVIGLVILILAIRLAIVPEDFGIHDTGYMYGWYRQGNLADWKAQKPKHRHTAADCAGCHDERSAALAASPHLAIVCENCHGAAGEHPEDPEQLPVDRSRELCLRCHTLLPYPTSGRAAIAGIDPRTHNPGEECASCHDPHHPNLEEM